MKRIHVWISGVVQGVGFRYFTTRNARELQVKGWVKNLPNGKVEVVAEGEKWRIKDFLDNLKVGPYSASVSGVEVKEEEYKGEFEKFEVRF